MTSPPTELFAYIADGEDSICGAATMTAREEVWAAAVAASEDRVRRVFGPGLAEGAAQSGRVIRLYRFKLEGAPLEVIDGRAGAKKRL